MIRRILTGTTTERDVYLFFTTIVVVFIIGVVLGGLFQ